MIDDDHVETGEHDEVPTYTVGELARAINGALGEYFGGGIWVTGEIQGWNARGKHAYFSLVEDADGDKATLRVQLFAYARNRIRPILEKYRIALQDGLDVRIFGQLDFWAPGGSIGLKMTDIDPRFTLGELAMAREELLRRLRTSGRFDANRERPLTLVPLRIGLVTSTGTAAWHDFVDELSASRYGFRLEVFATRVQGDGAAESIAAAISAAGAHGDLDAIVVIRGGGARNELATFDDERIADAILDSPLPVLTGIGHEIDRSIADEVAHIALKTPTACARFLIDRVRAYSENTERIWQSITASAARRLELGHLHLSERAQRIARRTESALERASLRLDHRHRQIVERPAALLERADTALGRATGRIIERPSALLERADGALQTYQARLDSHDPEVLLARGWTLTLDGHGRIVRSVSSITPGEELTTRLSDGAVRSTVTATEPATRADDIRRDDPHEQSRRDR